MGSMTPARRLVSLNHGVVDLPRRTLNLRDEAGFQTPVIAADRVERIDAPPPGERYLQVSN